MNWRELLQSKTFWTGIGGIVGAVGGFVTHTIDVASAAQLALTSLIGIFLRDAVSKDPSQ